MKKNEYMRSIKKVCIRESSKLTQISALLPINRELLFYVINVHENCSHLILPDIDIILLPKILLSWPQRQALVAKTPTLFLIMDTNFLLPRNCAKKHA